jgi:hypothetical protein
MRKDIESNLDNPQILENLYRENKTVFKKEFNSLFPEIKDSKTAEVWNERLNYDNNEISWGSANELGLVIIASLAAVIIAKIPQYTGIDADYFYQRNIAFIVFPLLTVYFAWKQKIGTKKIFLAASVLLVSVVFINVLPDKKKSDTLILACIHLPLLLWAVLGFTFVGDKFADYHKRLDYLKFNGDLVVMSTVILIAGMLLTILTLGLFSLINVRIEDFYFEYIVVWGLAGAPIFGTFLVQTNPQLVSKVSPVIAKIFTPLVLATLAAYLVAIVYSGKDPYGDREFLLIFNVLLIGVMAIILFSIAETSNNGSNIINTMLLFFLSILTIIVNGIALSAIIFRISEWGITPNRLAVLGGNILILTNLCLVTFRLYKALKNKQELQNVEKSIATFLPIYSLWTVVVVFIFPLLFSFK